MTARSIATVVSALALLAGCNVAPHGEALRRTNAAAPADVGVNPPACWQDGKAVEPLTRSCVSGMIANAHRLASLDQYLDANSGFEQAGMALEEYCKRYPPGGNDPYCTFRERELQLASILMKTNQKYLPKKKDCEVLSRAAHDGTDNEPATEQDYYYRFMNSAYVAMIYANIINAPNGSKACDIKINGHDSVYEAIDRSQTLLRDIRLVLPDHEGSDAAMLDRFDRNRDQVEFSTVNTLSATAIRDDLIERSLLGQSAILDYLNQSIGRAAALCEEQPRPSGTEGAAFGRRSCGISFMQAATGDTVDRRTKLYRSLQELRAASEMMDWYGANFRPHASTEFYRAAALLKRDDAFSGLAHGIIRSAAEELQRGDAYASERAIEALLDALVPTDAAAHTFTADEQQSLFHAFQAIEPAAYAYALSRLPSLTQTVGVQANLKSYVKARIAYYRAESTGKADEIARAYDTLQDAREAVGDAAFAIARERPTLQQIQSFLGSRPGDNPAVLAFFIGRERSFAMLITRDDVRAWQIGGTPGELGSKIQEFRDLMDPRFTPKNPENNGDVLNNIKTAGQTIYTLVFGGATDQMLSHTGKHLSIPPRLIVIPHGPTLELPLAGLMNNNHWLIEHHAISYAPSLKAVTESGASTFSGEGRTLRFRLLADDLNDDKSVRHWVYQQFPECMNNSASQNCHQLKKTLREAKKKCKEDNADICDSEWYAEFFSNTLLPFPNNEEGRLARNNFKSAMIQFLDGWDDVARKYRDLLESRDGQLCTTWRRLRDLETDDSDTVRDFNSCNGENRSYITVTDVLSHSQIVPVTSENSSFSILRLPNVVQYRERSKFLDSDFFWMHDYFIRNSFRGSLDIVLLSACSTAQQSAPGGPLSLPFSAMPAQFSILGARTIVSTQWIIEVGDMIDFNRAFVAELKDVVRRDAHSSLDIAQILRYLIVSQLSELSERSDEPNIKDAALIRSIRIWAGVQVLGQAWH